MSEDKPDPTPPPPTADMATLVTPDRMLATRVSAKEAFSKAIGLGLHAPMAWRACEVVSAPSGKPGIALHGELARWFDERRLRAHVTLTDEGDYAAAFVVVETIDEGLPTP